jgi:hypothetical protein
MPELPWKAVFIMPKSGCSSAVFLTAVLFLAGAVWAKPPVYKWVEDQNGSSNQLLQEAQATRVISLPEAGALKLIRQVMTEDLYLALNEYHATRHRQDAETVRNTVLPENVAGKDEIVLWDENFRFVLEVSLQAYGNRTRVRAQALPLYRLHDLEKEEEAEPQGTAPSLGDANFEPIPGQPQEDQAETLPDAADRAQKLVRSFFYLLDRRLAGQAKGK